mmetsp:Transcript_162577/g.312172  ORF Transcript_162577/g.312172 Transcript_162577/m.312172 type:complete len:233 (+) Transcript_162577:149-847(+)
MSLFIEDEAAHALWSRIAAQLLGRDGVLGHFPGVPANVIPETSCFLHPGLFELATLLLLLEGFLHYLRCTLGMHRHPILAFVPRVTNWQLAMGAEGKFFPIGVLPGHLKILISGHRSICFDGLQHIFRELRGSRACLFCHREVFRFFGGVLLARCVCSKTLAVLAQGLLLLLLSVQLFFELLKHLAIGLRGCIVFRGCRISLLLSGCHILLVHDILLDVAVGFYPSGCRCHG